MGPTPPADSGSPPAARRSLGVPQTAAMAALSDPDVRSLRDGKAAPPFPTPPKPPPVGFCRSEPPPHP